ncbi:MAG TPA: lipoate--protein ligase [Ignavibacteria bacterium]|nr:lipoate--protein ligase [Ignavibacteria bacterium]HMR39733.1 lipoate--protein ligase [Ignavibacteria bacterium]
MFLIDNKNITDPAINLALEEYCVRNLDMKNDYLLFYINAPSIIIGKHQNTIEEINQEYIKEKGIHVVRRISGGGAVYHDEGNLNFSFMTKHSHESIHNFRLFTEPVIKVLAELGINAELNGRNDITVSGRKISGNAQFTDTKSMFSHGTLLFDTKLEDVVNALNVRQEKIESKGIKSVRSRVANISEFLSRKITIDEFKKNIIESVFTDKKDDFVYQLSDSQWDDVMKLSESKYRSWDWNYGRSPEFDLRKTKRFSFGQIDFRINVKDGIITGVRIFGDFLGHGELSDIEDILTGLKFQEDEIRKVLSESDLKNYFGDITAEEMAEFVVS